MTPLVDPLAPSRRCPRDHRTAPVCLTSAAPWENLAATPSQPVTYIVTSPLRPIPTACPTSLPARPPGPTRPPRFLLSP
jgi:hypothetical protein